MVGKSCWVAILEVTSEYFFNNIPIFIEKNDPYTLRFNVKPIVILNPKYYVPFRIPPVWEVLSFTKKMPINSSIVFYKNSLNKFPSGDGEILEKIIIDQDIKKYEYPQKTLKTPKKNISITKATPNNKQTTIPKVINDGSGNETYPDTSSLREVL